MRVVVFGASGRTGQLLVQGALARGHLVTAFVRRAEDAPGAEARLHVVVGDILDPTTLPPAIAAEDAVIFAAGSRSRRHPALIHAQGLLNVMATMRRYGVRRLICVSASLAGPDPDRTLPFITARIVKPLFLRNLTGDMARGEAAVRQSALDWTIVRAPRLTDGPATGRYRVGPGYALPHGRKIARADLAEYLLDQLETDENVGHAVAIAW